MFNIDKFDGGQLRIARLYNSLTLTELAAKLDVSKQSVSLYENNKIVPDCGKIMELAKILGFPFEFFFRNAKFATKTDTTYFRSLLSTTKKERKAQSLKLEFVAQIYEVLCEYIDFCQFIDPMIEFDCDSDESQILDNIEVASLELRKQWKIGDGPIENLKYILESHGLLVTRIISEDSKIDAFSQRTVVGDNDVYFIAIAKYNSSESRVRFDMAHELGHIILHPWSEDLDSISREEFRARENQANLFAGSFLLPRDEFLDDVRKRPNDLNFYRMLKKKWHVSIQAMINRAHQIGVISANQYTYLMRQVSKNGWRKVEPEDYEYCMNDSIFQGAIGLLFDNHIFTPRTLLKEFDKNGIVLFPNMIEELLCLKHGMLAPEYKNNVTQLHIK